jgi:hypothetical protein
MRRFTACAAPLLGGLLLASASAASPASIAPSRVDSRAEASFAAFASGWMQKVHARGVREQARPTLRPGALRPIVTYRAASDAYEIELRPTGRATSPYVGVLRYTEHVYRCEDLTGTTCEVASSSPVTELFRYRGGRWGH